MFVHAKGHFRYLNPAAVRLLGADSAEQLLGLPVLDRVHPDDHATVLARLQRLEQGAEVSLREETYLRLDGSPVAVEVSAVPVRYNDEVGGLVCVRDLNRHPDVDETLRREHLLLRQVIDANPSLISVKDRSGRFLLANEALARAYQSSIAEIQGRTEADFNPSATEVAASQRDDLEVMDSRCARRIVKECVTFPDRSRHWLSGSKIPLCDADGRCDRILLVALEIGESQHADPPATDRMRYMSEREREFRSLADNVPDNIVRFDLDGRGMYFNKALEATLGRSADELIGKIPTESAQDGRYAALEATVRRVGATGESAEVEQIVPGPSGESRHHLIRIVAEPGPDGRPASVLAVGRDVTQQKRVEEELRLAASVFHSSADGVLVTDAAGKILSVNPAFTEITGYARDEALGSNPRMLRSDRHTPEFYRAMWQGLEAEGRWQGEIWNRRKGGEAYLEWLTINRIDDSDGNPVRYVAVFHDITELKTKDERIRHLAFHDALTGLPNRTLMQDRLQQALARARREGGRLALTYIDLDRFKAVNDSFGHDVGDLLLQEVARRIQGRLRASDTVARLGGDEFVVLMGDLHDAEDCAVLAQELIGEIARPMSLRGHTFAIGASMGTAFFPEDGDDALEMMKRADVAMYAAKSAGRNTYRFFQAEMLERTSQRLTLEIELRRAVANGDLELHYQPRVDLTTGRTLGVEALVRWRHPDRGLIAPAEFISVAEESGIIHDVGDWVLQEACRQSAIWRAGGRSLCVAINVSARQLEDGALAARIAELAARHGIDPAGFEIDITESAVMANPEDAAGLFARLRGLGVTVAVDDFGTGYSSLAYLRRLPLDTLKIDRSFISDVEHIEEDAQIVRTILALGDALKLKVVAEGVETQRQAELLLSLGCQAAQGYLFAPALPVPYLERWLDGRASGTQQP